MIAEISTYLVNLMETIGYPGLLFAMFIENIIPPIPSEVIMPLAGYLAATGKMNIVLVLIVAALGSTLGTLPYYLLGMYMSKAKIRRFVTNYGKYFFYTPEKLDNLYKIFENHDSYWVFFARFLPGARSLISLPAGSAHMPWTKFFSLTLLGTTIRISLRGLLGFFFGQYQSVILHYLEIYEQWAKYGLVLLVVVLIGYSVWKR